MEQQAPPVEIPADLQQSRPRRVRLSGTGRAFALWIALLLAGAPTAAVFMYRAALDQREVARRLDAEGAVTEARVTWLKRESKDSNRASVYYEFFAGGRVYSARANVRMAQWRELRVGAALPVRYITSNPDESIPDGLTPRVLPLWLPYLLAGVMLAAGGGCFALLRADRRLLEEGRVATATVREHIVSHSQHGTQRSIKYDFPTLSGVRVSGQSGTSRKPPAVGSGILVLYDSESPKRNKPYPLTLVRLEVL